MSFDESSQRKRKRKTFEQQIGSSSDNGSPSQQRKLSLSSQSPRSSQSSWSLGSLDWSDLSDLFELPEAGNNLLVQKTNTSIIPLSLDPGSFNPLLATTTRTTSSEFLPFDNPTSTETRLSSSSTMSGTFSSGSRQASSSSSRIENSNDWAPSPPPSIGSWLNPPTLIKGKLKKHVLDQSMSDLSKIAKARSGYGEDREAHSLAIMALSERDKRDGKGEDLHFQSRPGTGGTGGFSKTLREGDKRYVAIEPQYYRGNATGTEQEEHRIQDRGFLGTYPDWVARSGGETGKLISFDLKVPYAIHVGRYLGRYGEQTEALNKINYTSVEKEFNNRKRHMPKGTEQRLVFDLNSYGQLKKRKQHDGFKQYVKEYEARKKEKFYADSVQFIYRGKSGNIKASKPYFGSNDWENPDKPNSANAVGSSSVTSSSQAGTPLTPLNNSAGGRQKFIPPSSYSILLANSSAGRGSSVTSSRQGIGSSSSSLSTQSMASNQDKRKHPISTSGQGTPPNSGGTTRK